MKKTIMFLGVLSLGLAHAQQNDPYAGKVGVNHEEPNATLDIRAHKADGSQKEGLLIPRMGKAAISKIAQPEISTLIYVNDIAYTTGEAGADKRVELVDAVGFYHYNGTQWIKHLDTNTNDDEWVYEPTNKRINLRRSGGADMSNSSIFYNQHGAYINTNMLDEGMSYFNSNTNIVEQRLPDNYDVLANNILLKKITPDTYLELNDTGDTYSLLMNSNSAYVEDTKADGKKINLGAESSSIQTAPSNTKDYNLLRAVLNNASHHGTGNAAYMVGTYSDARLERGRSTGYVMGGRFTASYATNQSSNLQIGLQVYNQVLKTGGGKITSMFGSRIYNSIVNEFDPLAVTNFHGLDITNYFRPKVDLTLTNVIGINYTGLNPATQTSQGRNITVANNYGIKIGDIKGATAANYAIYTGAGKVYLGDEVEVKSTIKVADNTADTTCTPTKAGTIRFKDKKFQGCTGTEWKDLHN